MDKQGWRSDTPVFAVAELERLGESRFMRTINAVNERLTTTAMIQMNRNLELDRQDPAIVAQRFLRTAGLLGGAD